MDRKIILFFLLTVLNVTAAKSQSGVPAAVRDRFDWCEPVDSVILAYEVFYDKETSLEFDEPAAVPSLKRSSPLSADQINAMRARLSSAASYTDRVALPSHCDVFVYYYRGDSIEKSIAISSITRNISFIKGDFLIQGGVSQSFENYLTDLLQATGVWSKTMRFYEF